jgi:4-amino-4-deoxy-L-arabinose transferase-like glycosyltransferase
MPDPMMVSGTVIALWALYNWQEKQEIKWAILTGIVTGFTIFTKTVAGIILIFPFAFFLLSSNSLKSLLKNTQVWVILVLSALPAAGYYYYGIFIDGGLASQFGGRFFPHLWTDLVFYKTWGMWIIKEFNILAFLGGLVGIFLARSKSVRWLLFGWWAGIFVYGMIFAYHTMTHNYYHLPLVPVVAVSLSPLIAAAVESIREEKFARFSNIVFTVLVVVFIAFSAYEYISFVNAVDYRQQKTAYEEIGEIFSSAPPEKRIALTNDYETSLRFYAMLKAAHWPGSGDLTFKEGQTGKSQSFENTWLMTEGYTYFLVTDFKDLDRQPELKEKLSTYPIYAQGEGYVIYYIGNRE